jgi:nucleoid-associated protein YgaU
LNNNVRRQQEWLPLAGEFVEVRLDEQLIRSGWVDAVTSDGEILWIAAQGAEPRTMFERSQCFTVRIESDLDSASDNR